MQFTPFGYSEDKKNAWTKYLNGNGIFETKNEKEADLYVTRRFPILTKSDLYLWRIKHRYIPVLVWTHEPRYCTETNKIFKSRIYKPEIHVMDVYTDDVYLNPYTWYGHCIEGFLTYVNEYDYYSKKASICCLGTYSDNSKCYINGINVDLIEKRQEIAIYGYNNNKVDISGINWPKDIKTIKSDRLDENWHQNKLIFLKQYRYNLCCENTDYKYYITEKIWDSITARCLPIYYGNQYIYEIFPKKSFLDINEFNNYEQLFKYLDCMKAEEYCARLNKCIDVYNKAYKEVDFQKEELKSIDMAIQRIKAIILQNQKYY